MTTRAYVLRGMWVADCPRPGCNNTEQVIPAASFHCSYCQQLAALEWPNDRHAIRDVLGAAAYPAHPQLVPSTTTPPPSRRASRTAKPWTTYSPKTQNTE